MFTKVTNLNLHFILCNICKFMFTFYLEQIPKRFLFGFPASWERCVAEFLGGDSNTPAVSGRISDSDKFAAHSESIHTYKLL